jgi:hypothetical protein
MCHSSHVQPVPCFVGLFQEGRMVALYEHCPSMSIGRQVASYLRRHHLVAEGVEVRVVRR